LGGRRQGLRSRDVEATRIAFFKKSALDGFDWREQFSNADATRVFRFGARCEENRCSHFNGSQCSLGARVKHGLPAVVDALPACLIRPKCRWFAEQGGEVCLRCPQVVTMIPEAETPLNAVAAVR
jgi:hypothetical protein